MAYMKQQLAPGTYIPMFDLEARFCYFLDLNEPKEGESPLITAAKYKTFNRAQNALVEPIKQALSIQEKEKQDATIKEAIEFLFRVAQSERDKEIRIVNKYIKDIENDKTLQQLMTKEKQDDLKNLLNDLKEFSNNPNKTDMADFYSKLTLIINAVRSDAEYFKERIEKLNVKDEKSRAEIADYNITFRQAEDADTMLRSALGIQQRQTNTSFNRIIMTNIGKYIKNNLKNNELFKNNIYEALVGILIDFENFLKFQYKDLMQKNKEELEEILSKKFEEYTQSENSLLYKIQRETEEAREQLAVIHKLMGFGELKKVDESYKKRLEILEKQATSKTRDTRNKMRDIVKDILGEDYNEEISQTFSWSVSSGKNGQHGLVYEIAKMLEENSQKIRTSAGTDLLYMDLARIRMSLHPRIETQTKKIRKALEKSGAIGQKRKNRLSNLSKNYAQTSEEIRNATQKLNDLLKYNKQRSDLFIYHESLKLYATIEQHKNTEFEGRTLGILNGLDSLYTANGIAGLQLINQNLLYGIATNLAKNAVGGVVKPEVEDYLSIFAGLLMFDDIQNMALDAANNAAAQVSDYGQAFNIHLYLLNDVYVPGSLLLTSIAEALRAGYTKLTSSDGARVKINTSEADSTIQDYLNRRKSGEQQYRVADWRTIGNEMASQIKIKIIFLTSFFNFIESLEEYMTRK